MLKDLFIAVSGLVFYFQALPVSQALYENLDDIGMTWSFMAIIYGLAFLQVCLITSLSWFAYRIHPKFERFIVKLMFIVVLTAIISQTHLLIWPAERSFHGGLILACFLVAGLLMFFMSGRGISDYHYLLFLKFLAVSGIYSTGLLLWCLFLVESHTPVKPAPAPSRNEASKPSLHILLFDEFSAEAIVDKNKMIDPKYAPFMAEFAKRATWYSNWNSNYALTVSSVPSILGSFYRTPKFRTNLIPELKLRPTLFGALAPTRYIRIYSSIASTLWLDMYGGYAHAHISPRSIASTSFKRKLGVLYRLWRLDKGLPLENLLPDVSFGGNRMASKKENSAIVKALLTSKKQTRHGAEFVFAHLFMPHSPYRYLPNGSMVDRTVQFDGKLDSNELKHALQCYREEIRYVDNVLRDYVKKLQDAGDYDNAILVVTSDHGTSWEEGNNGRLGIRVNDMLTHVPMIIKYPHQKAGVVDSAIHTQLDLAPTLLKTLGINYSFCEGKPIEHGHSTEHAFYHNNKEWIHDPATGTWTVLPLKDSN